MLERVIQILQEGRTHSFTQAVAIAKEGHAMEKLQVAILDKDGKIVCTKDITALKIDELDEYCLKQLEKFENSDIRFQREDN